MRYKGILLDLDDTLYAYKSCNEAGWNAVIISIEDYLNTYDEEIEFLLKNAREFTHHQLKNTAAMHSRLLYFKKFIDDLNQSTSFHIPIQELTNLHNAYWDAYFLAMNLETGVLEFLDFCKANHLKIAIVTDFTLEIQLRKIEKLNISSYIDTVISSEEVGIEKPSSKIFEYVLNVIKLSNQDVCMVGDSFEKDYLGAMNMGIKAYHFNRNLKEKKENFEFGNFNQLINILENE
jgi:putative hydrolase of the HAD superfamily